MATDDHQNARIAEKGDHEDDEVERDEVPDAVRHLHRLTLPDRRSVADTVDHARRGEVHGESIDERGTPAERHCGVNHPSAYLLGRMNDLQIAIDGDGGESDLRTEKSAIQRRCFESAAVHIPAHPLRTENSPPHKRLTEDRRTQPVPGGSCQTDIDTLGRVRDDQEDAAEQVESILVDDEQVLFVLLRNNQRVDDDGVGCGADDSDGNDSALEIEGGSARRR